MKHYIPYINLNKIEFNLLNECDAISESWKDVAIGTVLALTSILPMSMLSQDVYKIQKGYTIDYVVSNRILSSDEIKNILHKLFTDGFKSQLKDHFSVSDVDYLPEGSYMIVNASGFDITNLITVLDYTLDAYTLKYAPRMEKKKIYKLFRGNQNYLEGVAVVFLQPYPKVNPDMVKN